jgi:hypothetical protein
MNLEEKRAVRLKLLHEVYRITGGDRLHEVGLIKVGDELGINKEDTRREFDYLFEEGLLKYGSRGPQMSVNITHFGVKEVEEALSNPNDSTKYFPALNLIIQVDKIDQSTNIYGDVDHSNISAHSSNVTQRTGQGAEILGLLDEIFKKLQDDATLPHAVREDCLADMETLRREMDRQTPRTGILRELLSSLGPVSSIAGLVLQMGTMLGITLGG